MIGFFIFAPCVVSSAAVTREPSKIAVTSQQGIGDTSTSTLKSLEAAVFSDVPAMKAVIQCESQYRQFDASGKPLMSKTQDVGIAQIHVPVWGKLAKLLDLDIYNSATDNLVMARIIYRLQGIHAWTCAD